MRELHSLPENPIFPDPSANPAEFLKQGGRLIGKLALDFLPRIPFTDVDMPPTSLDDAILDQIKKYPLLDKVKPAAELAAGVASGLARATLTDDVAEQRKPILDAYKQVIAAALDPTYKLDLAGTDASSRALASALYNRLVELPYLDRYRIAIYLALRSDTKDWLGLEERLDGRIFARGADFVLFNSEYRYDSTDPGRHVLFGLSLVIVDGQIKVVDARGQVIGSADVEDTTDQRTGDLSPGSAPAPAGKDDAGPTAPSDMAGTGAFMASDARTIDGGLLFDAPSTAPSPTAKDAVDVDGKPGDAAPANTLPSAGTDDSPGASPLKAPPSDNSPDSYTTQQAQTSDDPPDAYSCPAQTSDDPPDAYTCPAQPSDDPPDAYSTQGAPTRATPEPPPEAIPAAADDGPQPSAPAGGGS